MKIKTGVSLKGLQPQIVLALLVVQQIWTDRNMTGPTITSCSDGEHGYGSLHHTGMAIDIRRPITQTVAQSTVDEIRRRLGELEYDVVLKDDHIHIEYQP